MLALALHILTCAGDPARHDETTWWINVARQRPGVTVDRHPLFGHLIISYPLEEDRFTDSGEMIDIV